MLLRQPFSILWDEKRRESMAKQYWRPGNLVYPVPVVMVSCQKGEERPNIITAAWCGTTCSSPAMLYVSIRPDRYSHHIIKESGEFVVNLVTEELAFATDFCGVRSGRDTDKFKEMKLTPLASKYVSCPGIAESPVNLECRVTQILPLGSHDMFLAEVVGVTADEAYMDENGRFDLNSAGLVAYSHGEYFKLGKKVGKFGYSVQKKKKENGKKQAAEEKRGAAGKKAEIKKSVRENRDGRPGKAPAAGKGKKKEKSRRVF